MRDFPLHTALSIVTLGVLLAVVRPPSAAQFRALEAYSPYQHVSDATRYPAVFFLAGENDGRVNPAHSRKMCARLQAASTSDQPVLIRLSAASGHGMGTALTERIAEKADVLAFLFAQLDMHALAK